MPSDKRWLEQLIKPLIEDRNVVAVVSDLYLPEWYWKKYPFLVKILTISDRRIRKPDMDSRACAYRKKDLEKAGLFNEDPKVIGIEIDLHNNLKKMGKLVRSNIRVYHLHKYPSFRKIVSTLYDYSKSNGKVIRTKTTNSISFWYRIMRALPIFGFMSILYRYPIETHLRWFPLYIILAAPVNHIVNIFGFWDGFFFERESKRNTEVLKEQNNKI
jgi:GT2 family glycosyltransferase